MNRVLEKVFPSFSRHGAGQTKSYYSFPEGSDAASVTFQVKYSGNETVADGRVVLFFAPVPDPEPRHEAFDLEQLNPIFAKDVEGVSSRDTIEFHNVEFSVPEALAFVPGNIDHFDTGELYVQALIEADVSDPDPNTCTKNWYSAPVKVSLDGKKSACVVEVVADKAICNMTNTSCDEFFECTSMRSTALSDYHGVDVHLYAAIVLPKGYHQRSPDERFPTVYYIEGFTGTEEYASRARAFLNSAQGAKWKAGTWPTPMIRVTLGSRFRFGHTSFANSEVNGPWATALVTEFIPFLEARYAMVQAPQARFLHGHSSGGWSSLWLQLQHPDIFGGTWSTSPDPVDFSYFQTVDIYNAKNMYWDPYGRPYPTSRSDGVVTCTIRDENQVERVYARGNGGQWDAFFALFSPRNPINGMPVPLYDKVTGEIDASVAQYWSQKDICRILRQKRELLSTTLRGKIHVICGIDDNYYLNDACASLRTLFIEAASDVKVQPEDSPVPNYVDLLPGDHTTIRSRQHYERIHQEIAAAFAAFQS